MRTKQWTVQIHLAEDVDGTSARAVLLTRGGGRVDGLGRAHRAPAAAPVPGSGDDLAAARALADLAGKLNAVTRLPPPRTAMPAGYPRDLERTVELQDGRAVFLRPIVPGDAAALAEAIRDADADTLRRRFLGAPPPLTGRLLRHLTTVDYARRLALVGFDPRTGRGVAVARYEPVDERTAEVAIAVDPSWRRAGLATAMVELLARAALEHGYDTFTATYLADNRPVAALVTGSDGRGRQEIRQGLAEVAVALDRTRAAGPALEPAPGPAPGPAPRPVTGPVPGPAAGPAVLRSP